MRSGYVGNGDLHGEAAILASLRLKAAVVNTGGIAFPKQQVIIVERYVAITIERDDANKVFYSRRMLPGIRGKKKSFKLALVYKLVLLSDVGDNTRNT